MLELLTRVLFIPGKSTLLIATNNGKFLMWQSLTDKNITKFIARQEATALGHMYQVHKKNCSTRTRTNKYAGE